MQQSNHSSNTKKVFIVVGSMGVGKSCFIKELLDDQTRKIMEKEQEKQRGAKKKDGVNLGASISSDTNSCKIYKIKKGFPLFTVKNFNH